MMFKYSLNFKQVVERSFGQPNILAVGSKSFNNRFLQSDPTIALGDMTLRRAWSFSIAAKLVFLFNQ